MINPATLSFFSFLLSALSMVAIYYILIILPASMYLIVAVVLGIFYFFNRRTNTLNRRADKLMILSSTFFLVSMIASVIYNKWKLTNLFSVVGITKSMVVILGILALYLNVVYIRAEQSYKKKRGNQRIKQEVKQGYVEQFMEGFRKEEESNEIVLKIGISAENED